MNFLEKLDALKVQSGDNNLSLAQRTGIPPSTIYGLYKKGYKNIQLSTLQTLCDYFGVSLDYMAKDNGGRPDVSTEAHYIARMFDSLDNHGQHAVRAVLDAESARMAEPVPPHTFIRLFVYDSPAAAGAPLWAESEGEYVDFAVEDVPEGAHFGVRIQGDSMEPEYPDGCVVFVKPGASVYNNDDIIAWLDGDGSVFKRAITRNDRLVRLESINRTGPKFSGLVLEGVRVRGRVLGYTVI